MADVSLTWDANGNLANKGTLTFLYDYRNRLSQVKNGETVVAAYAYDAFDRRIERTAGGVTEETVWSAWQPIETYRGGLLSSRRTYGPGLDEVVSLERDADEDGDPDEEYVPFYDSTGNLALLTDVAGKPIERYTYSPYGQQWIQVDSTPPSIEQLRVKDGKISIEMSEEILLEELEKAIAAGSLSLTHLSTATAIDLRVVQPVKTGRQARRRFVLDPTPAGELSWPAPGEDVELVVPAAALKDLFGNVAVAGLPAQTFTWPAADEVIADSAAPRLEEACVESGGILRVQFSEELSLAGTAAEIKVDGVSIAWIPGADGYTLRSEEGLDPGSHTLSVGIGALDLAGQGLAQAFEESFEVDASGPEQLVFSAELPGLVESSTVGNAYGFHGLPRDPETGLIYARHRYYDPELGRFISTDPFGYADGPSPYQYALNNPANFSDPTGEIVPAVLGYMAVAGLASVGIGAVFEAGISESPWGDQTFDYGARDIAIDFTLGAATFGMSNYFKAGRWGLDGARLFAAHRGLETGVDVLAEYARDPSQTAGQLAFGAVLNFAIGEAGTAAGRHFARIGKTGQSGLGGTGGGYRVKTSLRAGSSADGGRGIVPGGGVPTFRVQGGVLPNASKVRFGVDDAGKLSISGDDMLFVNVNQEARAVEFLARRGETASLVRFELRPEFVEKLRNSSVRQELGRANPTLPQRVDVTAAPDQFGIPASLFDELIQNVVPGSVRITKP